MSLVASFLVLVQPLSEAFTAPSFRNFLTLLTGWLFAQRRTVTGCLLAAGAVGSKHHSVFHRFFSRAAWSLDALGLLLFDLLLAWLPLDGTIYLTLDDTLACKRGRHMFGVGFFRDPLKSGKTLSISSLGHDWVTLCVVVNLPCCPDRVFSLPLLFRLYIGPKVCPKTNQVYKTRPQLAVEMLALLCAHAKKRGFHLLVDGAYNGETVLNHLPENCDLTTRLPLMARLYEAAPARKPSQRGRPRVRGEKLPSPKEMLKKKGRVYNLELYGKTQKRKLVERVAYWYKAPTKKLRVVVVQSVPGDSSAHAFYSTAWQDSGLKMLVRYTFRWSIEEMHQGAKTGLGFEEPQGWSELAVKRTAPMAMLLYTLVVYWFGKEGYKLYEKVDRPWYQKKKEASFWDMLNTLKRESLKATILPLVGIKQPSDQFIRALSCAVHAPL
jgi:DDE superfamily endonuclease